MTRILALLVVATTSRVIGAPLAEPTGTVLSVGWSITWNSGGASACRSIDGHCIDLYQNIPPALTKNYCVRRTSTIVAVVGTFVTFRSTSEWVRGEHNSERLVEFFTTDLTKPDRPTSLTDMFGSATLAHVAWPTTISNPDCPLAAQSPPPSPTTTSFVVTSYKGEEAHVLVRQPLAQNQFFGCPHAEYEITISVPSSARPAFDLAFKRGTLLGAAWFLGN